MANGKYTFEDMEAEKSNVQDLGEYLGFNRWTNEMAKKRQLEELEQKLGNYRNPSYDRLGQLRGRGLNLGDAKSYLAAEQAAQAAGARRQTSATAPVPSTQIQPSNQKALDDAASYAAYLAAQKAAGPPISQRTPPTNTRALGGSPRLTTQQQAAKTAESAKATSATAQQAIADAYAAMEAAKTGNTAANVIANMSADDQMRMILAQNANAEAAAAQREADIADFSYMSESDTLGRRTIPADDQMRAILAAGGDFPMGGPAGAAGVADDTAGIQAAAQAEAAAAAAAGNALSPFGEGLDSRGRAIGDYDFGDGKKGLGGGDPEAIAFLEAWNADVLEGMDLTGLDPVEAARIYENKSADMAKDQGFISDDVHTALLEQIITDEGGNINAPIFKWGINTETGADQIVMAPVEEQIVVPAGGDGDEGGGGDEGGDDDPPIVVPPEGQLTYEQKQKNISTNTYNDRIKYIQAAVKAGQMDLDTAQTEFNTAKNLLFAQMAELNKATYGTVEDEFQARTTQRGTDVADMLALLAEQGVEQNLIQDVIGGDIGMNLAGYGEETDAMRDFMGALELIGQQGASEAEMLGNYMFDSYRQDLDTTGRNMELQSAMQMLAEQQAAAEQNLQSQLLGPYFGLDPEMMMAGMGAGVDMAGYAEGRTARDAAADMAYQDNVWDYLMSQTMTPYQSGMLQVAQDEQQMDTLSSLMEMMQPSGAAAQAVADQNLYDAVMELQQGYIPATSMAPSPANNFMGASTPASTALERMTPAMLSALEGSDFALGDYLVDQARQEQEMFATVSLADAIGMDPMQLIGASQEGILNKLIDAYTFEMTGSGFNATASDPSLEFPIPPTDLNPAGSVEMVDLSKYKDMLDIYYPGWDGPPEERTFEMMTPSGQTISVGAELSDLGAYVEFLMNAGVSQDQILQYVQGMIPIGTATGE